MNIEKAMSDLKTFRESFVIAVGDKSPFAKQSLKVFDNAIEELEKQSPAVAVPDEETNFCSLKSIKDSEVAKVVRAFWRRIYPYRNDFGIELSHPLPVEFMAHMATALTWVDREPSPRITEQDALEIAFSAIHSYSERYGFDVDKWLDSEGRALLEKLNKPRVYVAPNATGDGSGSDEDNYMSIAGVIRQDCIGFEENSKNPHVFSFNTVNSSEPISGNTFLKSEKPESVGG